MLPDRLTFVAHLTDRVARRSSESDRSHYAFRDSFHIHHVAAPTDGHDFLDDTFSYVQGVSICFDDARHAIPLALVPGQLERGHVSMLSDDIFFRSIFDDRRAVENLSRIRDNDEKYLACRHNDAASAASQAGNEGEI